MAKSASLPFKGTFEHSQGFGARPSVYAKFGLQGHDGDDWKMPEGTVLFSPVAGKVTRALFDRDGWGLYVQIRDAGQELLVNIAHMSQIAVRAGQSVNKGQIIGYSGNTGFSEAPHVHVAAADMDANGFITNTNNGFKGWYSIMDSGKISLDNVPTNQEAADPGSDVGDTQEGSGPGGIQPGDYPAESLTQEQRNWLWQFFGNSGEAPVGYGGQRTDEVPGSTPTGLPTGPDGIKPGDYKATDLTREQRQWLWEFFGESGTAAEGFGGRRYFGEAGPWPDDAVYGPGGITPGSHDAASLTQEQRQWLFEYDGNTGEASVGYGGKAIGGLETEPEIEPPTVTPEEGQDAPVTTEPTPEPEPEPTPEPEPEPTPTPPSDKLDLIISKLDELLARPTTTAPPSEMEPPPASQQTAFLFIETTPRRASIYIDGQWQADYTPSNSPHKLAPGAHTIRLKKRGYKDYTETIDLEAFETRNLAIELQPDAS